MSDRDPRDADGAGIGEGERHRVQEFMVPGGVSAADRAGLVVDMLGRMIRMQHQLFDLGRVEMENPRLAVIDPDDGVIMAHESDPFSAT